MLNINPHHINLTAISPQQVREVLSTWRVGQVLKAGAVSASDMNGRFVMQIGAHRLYAWSPIPMRAGDPLTLQVKSVSDTPVMQILSAPAPAPETVVSHLRRLIPLQQPFTPVLEALQLHKHNTHIPGDVRASISRILERLSPLETLRTETGLKAAIMQSGLFLESSLRRRGTSGATLLSDFKAELLGLRDQVLQSLGERSLQRPPPTDQPRGTAFDKTQSMTTAQALQQLAVMFSERAITLPQLAFSAFQTLDTVELRLLIPFLEGAQRAQVTPTPERPAFDLFAKFLERLPNQATVLEALASLLRGLLALDELVTQIDHALNRIVYAQLLMSSREPSASYVLVVDLPVRAEPEPESIRVTIEREKADGDQQRRAWRIRLNFDNALLGKIQGDLWMQDTAVSSQFHAERGETVGLISEHLPLLHRSLSELGLNIHSLSAKQRDPLDDGVPPKMAVLDEQV